MNLNPPTRQTHTTSEQEQNPSLETRNHEGGVAYHAATPEKGLMMVCMTNLLEGGFYHDDKDELDLVRSRFDDLADENPEFVLKLANFARHEMYLRDIPIVLLVEAAHDERTQPYVREYAPAIISRADELATALAYHNRLAGERCSPPQALKKGLRDALFNFNAYKLTKWQQRDHKVSLVDVVNVVHPNPSDPQSADRGGTNYDAVIERLIKGDLDKYPDIEPLRQGDSADDGAVTWEAIVSDQKTMDVEFMTPLSANPERDKRVVKDDAETGVSITVLPKEVRYPNTVNLEYAVYVHGEDGEPMSDATVTLEPVADDLPYQYHAAGTYDTDESGATDPFPSPPAYTEMRVIVTVDTAAEAWRTALSHDEAHVPLYARVKNVRNMLEAGLTGEEVFGDADMEWVQNASLFPFRYWQAYNALHEAGLRDEAAMEWLTTAIDESAQNLPDRLEESFVAVDVSGSMDHSPVSNRSDLDRIDIATLFGAVLMNKGADVGVFSDDFARIDTAHYGEPTVSLKERIDTKIPHSGTNGYLPLDALRDANESYDRIIYLTDEELWDSRSPVRREQRTLKEAWDRYRGEVGSDTNLYIINLADYGTLSMPENYDSVYHMSGWSEKVFDFIEMAEQQDTIIREIESEWEAT